jgi:hypothetical protein
MKMFDSVVIACEQSTLDIAIAIRSSLELFRLNVYLHFCVQRKNVVSLLGGNIPDAEYVVLCCGGNHAGDSEPFVPCMRFDVVDQVNGKWQSCKIFLTPDNTAEYVRLPGRTVICNGCNTGQELLANAFLQTGCKAYIGPVSSVNQDSTALFTIAFFYHLLCNERDPSLRCSDEQAVQRASLVDRELREGTGVFHYYSSNKRL